MNRTKAKNRVAKWYLTFFVVVVFAFTALIFLYLRKQMWSSFNFGVEQFTHEIYEELLLYRSSLEVNDIDSVQWSPEKLHALEIRVNDEIVDEIIDNNLKETGFVQIQNLVTNRILYQSDKVKEGFITFESKPLDKVGYKPFEYHTPSTGRIRGLGYWGVRGYGIYYFIGIIPDRKPPSPKSVRQQLDTDLIFNIYNSISRDAHLLFIADEASLNELLDNSNVWAYVYQAAGDSIIWSSRNMKREELYIPSQHPEKEYLCTIKDTDGKKLKQYTEIHDKSPNYLYKIDAAVPCDYVRKSLLYLALYLCSGSACLVIIAWIGGRTITIRALRPVDEIIHAVREITSKSLDERLPVPQTNDEIVQLVRTFNELLDRLSKSFKLQKSLIADASHELRTPLSIIMSDIETALKHLRDEAPARDNLKEAISEIERMARIVEDLHWLSNSDAGQISVNESHIRLDDVLMHTLSRCQVLAKKRDVILAVGKVDILEYRGDEQLLIRALTNLVDNAIKFSAPKSNVVVSLVKNDKFVHFNVSDQGTGIPKKSMVKIFDRFYRVDSSRSRETGGSGLGLAIAKWIIEMHSGTIHAHSELSKGSTFTIALPV